MRRAAEERERAARTNVGTMDIDERQSADFPSEEPELVPELPTEVIEPKAPPVVQAPPVQARVVEPTPVVSAPPVAPPVAAQVPVDPEIRPAQVNGQASPNLPSVETRSNSLLQHLDARLETKTVVDDRMLPASREQYRRLAAALHQAQRTSGMKVVMVASAVAGEGKTLTASNLALTLSESYRRNVLLVDADLRRPSLHSVFQVPGEPGLSDGLISVEESKLPLHRLSPRLTVLPAGRPTSDPIGALTADRMRRLIDEAREVFDWVIIDTPPVGLLTDAALLSSMADGVVFVVKAESTSHDMVSRAIDAIGRERVMGVVLNRAKELEHRTNYDYYKYYYGNSKVPAKRT